MQDHQQIWEFGRWIARREPGAARLTWSGGEIVLGIIQGRIHRLDGLDPADLAHRLRCEGAGEDELLTEARALAEIREIPETKAMGAAKEALQEVLRQWLIDADREFSIDDEAPAAADGATISITHALVELVLADTEDRVAAAILPDRQVSLQRSAGFLELYAPLRLSEEADLIVAGITGTATVADVARGSEHHPDEVARLVAALVATGVLEADEPVMPGEDLDWPSDDFDDTDGIRRRIPTWLIGAIVAAAILIVVLAWVLLGGDDQPADDAAAAAGDWGIVVEMGCEPQDLQRMLKKRNTERKSLRTVKADPTNGDTCFRLVWGSFATHAAAEQAMGDVPSSLLEEGFQPHVIEVDDSEAEGSLESGG